MTGDLVDEIAMLRARVADLERAEVERREAEAALRESRARLRTVVANAPIVLFALDKEGVFTLSEGKALDVIGLRPGQVVGMSVFEIYKDNPIIQAECRRALGGERFTSVIDLPQATFETRYTPLCDAAGEVCGCIGVATDITDRRRAEKDLRESEDRFRMLAENIPGVIYLCRNDERFTMTYLNDAVQRLTGYSKERFLSDEMAFADLIDSADRPNVYVAVNDAIRRRATYHLIYRLHQASGNVIWVEEHGAGVFVGNELRYLEGYITDISKRIADEQALEQSRVDLEQRVADRTANLLTANEKNLKTQEELAHVLRVATVGELASGLAHELNQPLSAITNYIQGSRRRIDANAITPTELKGVFDKIAAQAERAARILRTVRGYITRREVSGTECQVNAVVRAAVALAELDTREHHVVVRLNLDDSIPIVEGDSVQIEQVILNLLRNGIEAMEVNPSNDRRLSITTRRRSDGEVIVSIRDNGPGLPSFVKDRVFEPFFTTKTQGLGMGLSISRSIIEAHQGRIWASALEPESCDESSQIISSGTEFHFTLPVKRRTP